MKRKVETLALVLILDIVIAFFCLTALHMSLVNQEKSVWAETFVRSGEGKLLAITFDDGPHPKYTKKLLDGLRERNVKASFFLVGKNISGQEELVRQMQEDGHLIGTHCYNHEDLTKMNIEEACDWILKTNDLIENITGKRPEYIRPPYGIWNEELEDCVRMTPVFWDIEAYVTGLQEE